MRFPPAAAALNIVLAMLFTVFAWLQRNDIDPAIYDHPSVIDAALWLLFYLLIAVLLVVILFRPLPRWLLLVALLACLIEMGRTGPGLYENVFGEESFTMTQVSMTAADPRVELTREFFGAVIALAGVGLLVFQNRRRVKRGRD
jgi:glucan phosphoethanolaminetransferase (alkaline phosphatase superfamily)